MNRKQKFRYLLAVYLVVTFVAILLGFLAFNREADTWQAILLNLATELLGVVFVFFLVNYLFLIEDWDLAEQVQALINRLNLNQNPSARDFFGKTPELETYIKQADQIDLCGVTLTSTLNKHFSELRQRLYDGATIRILIIDPKSAALEMATARSENTENSVYYQHRSQAVFNDIFYLHQSYQDYQAQENPQKTGRLTVKLLSYSPSFGMLQFSRSRGNTSSREGTAVVEIYPHHSGYSAPPIFTLTREKDGAWYDYFIEQFEEMWQAAKSWEPERVLEPGSDDLDHLPHKVRAADFFLVQPHLSSDHFVSAQTIYLAGFALARTTRDYISILSQRLIEGSQIRVIVADPTNEALLKQMALMSVAFSEEQWQNSIQSTKNYLQAAAQNPDNRGQLEIGYLPYLPSFGLAVTDPDEAHGYGFVEIYHHKTTERNATFILRANDDPEWYEFFKQQYELLWASCRIEQLS